MHSHLDPNSTNQEPTQQDNTPATPPLPPSNPPPMRQENYSGTNVQAAFNRYSQNIIELLETLSKHDEITILEKNHKNEILSIKEYIHSWVTKLSTFSSIFEDLNPKDPVTLQNNFEQFIQEKYKNIYLEFKSIQIILNKLISDLTRKESQAPRARSGSGKVINQLLSAFTKETQIEAIKLPDILNKLVIEFGRINGLVGALFSSIKHPFIRTDFEIPLLNLSYHPFLKKLQDQSSPLLLGTRPGQDLIQDHLEKLINHLKSGAELNQTSIQSILKLFLSWFSKPTKQQAQEIATQIQTLFNSKSSNTASNQNAVDQSQKSSFEKLIQSLNALIYTYLITPLAYLEQTQIGNSINAVAKLNFKSDMSPIALWHAFIDLLKEAKPLIRQNEFQEIIRRLDAIKPDSFEVSAEMALADTILSYQNFSYSLPIKTENGKDLYTSTPLKLNSTLYHLHAIISTILYHTTNDYLFNKFVSGDALNLCVEHALTLPLSHSEMELLTPNLKYIEFLILSNLNSSNSADDKFKNLREKFQEEIIKIKSLPIKNINIFLACFERLLPSITSTEQSKNTTQPIQPHFFIDYSLTEDKAKTKIFVNHLALIELKFKKYLETQQNAIITTSETVKASQLKTNGALTAQKILSEINLFKIEISHLSHCDLTSWIEKIYSILNENSTLNNPFSDQPVSVKLDNTLKLIYEDIKKFCTNLETGIFELPQTLTTRSRSGSASLSTSSNSFLSANSTTTLSSVPEIQTEPKIESATTQKM